MSRTKVRYYCKIREPSELSSRDCLYRIVETSWSQVDFRGVKGLDKEVCGCNFKALKHQYNVTKEN